MPTWPTLLPNPTQAFQIAHRTSNVETKMDSGRIRRRKRFSSIYRRVGVVWEFDDLEFPFFQGWHQNIIGNGADSFTISLPMGSGLRSVTAAFSDDGNYDAAYIPHLHWSVKAVLEVEVVDVLTASEVDALITANSLDMLPSYLT